MILKELKLLENCFYIDCNKFDKYREDEEIHDIRNLNLAMIEYFFSQDGENIILQVKDRFMNN
jgi:hypothetical protein